MLTDDALVLGAQARLVAAGLAGGAVYADHGEPSQDDKLPYCNVFVGMDSAEPEGDPRTGIARYEHKTVLVIEYIARANAIRALKALLGIVSEGILQQLLASREWATLDGEPFIEGFGSVKRVYDMPPEGNHLMGRVQIQIDVLHRSYWSEPTTSLVDLAAISVGFDLDNGDDAPVIGATLTVPTA